jgi:hypothetical protein
MQISDEQWAGLLRAAGNRASSVIAFAESEGLLSVAQPNAMVEGADAPVEVEEPVEASPDMFEESEDA